MEALAWITLTVWSLMLAVSVVNLASTWQPVEIPYDQQELVSVLIPARNEEKNIPRLLDALLKSRYPNLEIVVCDDHSTDATAQILGRYSLLDNRIQWFRGGELPRGWTGKNFACHQLSEKSSGSFLLFLDADVEPSPQLTTELVGLMKSKKLSMLSLFPRQQMRTLGEKLTVPLMDWILLSLLPLPLVAWSRRSSLAAANGQCMLFEADGYHAMKWHQLVRGITVDDITISRLVKKAGQRMAVLPGKNLISCRMYDNYAQAISGFARNIHEYFGGSTLVAITFWLLAGIAPLLLPIFHTNTISLILWMLIAMNRMVIELTTHGRLSGKFFLHPLQILAMGQILFRRMVSITQKKTVWKDREIPLQ